MSGDPTPPSARELPPAKPGTPQHILERGTYREYSRLEKVLTRETAGGIALLIATILALILANSPLADLYFGVRDTHLGFDTEHFHMNLSVAHWAADGLLAIFFFLVGLELKFEFVRGDLRDPKRAMVPMLAAAGGVAVPALIYTLVNLAGPADSHHGWAIPAATDIAFAVAVLTLVAPKIPSAIRTFLLTLAVVDDLIAILIIAIFYASDTNLLYLAASVPFIALFWFLAHRGEHLFKRFYSAAWLLMLPIGVIVWALFLNSGIHATIAGVVLAFCVPVYPLSRYGRDHSLAETLEHRFSPFSTGVAVPLFAFFSAGVAVGGVSGLTTAWGSTVALGVIVGLVCGKMIGITGTTWLLTRLTKADLDPDVKWIDLIGMSAVAGIGFTVSLLVTELSFPAGSELLDYAKVGVLTASLLAAIVGSVLLVPRNRHYAKIADKEKVDANQDGTPDAFADDSSKLA